VDARFGVGGFLLAREAGLRQIGLVNGVSAVQRRYRPHDPELFQDPGKVWRSEASLLDEARRTALERLARQAHARGASLVTDVRISDEVYELGEPGGVVAQFVATGTAVRRDAADAGNGDPVLTNLPVQDYWLLIRHGSEVLGLVGSFSKAASGVDLRGRVLGDDPYKDDDGGWEADVYTGAVSRGYAKARADMRAQLTTLGADGAVGVRIGHVQHKAAEGAHMITVRAIGTAIRRAMPMTGGDRPALAIMPVLGLGRGQEKGFGRHE